MEIVYAKRITFLPYLSTPKIVDGFLQLVSYAQLLGGEEERRRMTSFHFFYFYSFSPLYMYHALKIKIVSLYVAYK